MPNRASLHGEVLNQQHNAATVQARHASHQPVGRNSGLPLRVMAAGEKAVFAERALVHQRRDAFACRESTARMLACNALVAAHGGGSRAALLERGKEGCPVLPVFAHALLPSFFAARANIRKRGRPRNGR